MPRFAKDGPTGGAIPRIVGNEWNRFVVAEAGYEEPGENAAELQTGPLGTAEDSSISGGVPSNEVSKDAKHACNGASSVGQEDRDSMRLHLGGGGTGKLGSKCHQQRCDIRW